LRAAFLVATIRTVEASPLIYREEVTAILGVLGDLNEELEEDDT
jgi:hypothetical protein